MIYTKNIYHLVQAKIYLPLTKINIFLIYNKIVGFDILKSYKIYIYIYELMFDLVMNYKIVKGKKFKNAISKIIFKN